MKKIKKIKKDALRFQDKINRLGDLFKMYGFDVQYRGSLGLHNKNLQFYLRFADDASETTIKLIKKLSVDLNKTENYLGLKGKFIQEIWLKRDNKGVVDFYRWSYTYDEGYGLSNKLLMLNVDISAMEKIIFKKEDETK